MRELIIAAAGAMILIAMGFASERIDSRGQAAASHDVMSFDRSAANAASSFAN